ncbi:MAG: toxin-antitoxin system HicB family antitoxin [Candidatus Competibacteraceae bacterium]|mgnify:CR=1 FL=1|nr:toxin-antitoxin system HicB family antitoxin [Candidatus Competibacteraceae bacterium]MCP5127224.1 toxin-antitoxin system HicB family antitoxin [Gammaproteobacteria bacterium]HRX71086.1 toxin-antitoxin system HicB family antitoxin [Candidatus Competibacteraceae bacterium]
MSTLTIRLPNDTHDRLRQLAALRGVSLNKLMEEISIQTLSSFDAETRFRALAAQADPQRALAILNRLDEQNQITR